MRIRNNKESSSSSTTTWETFDINLFFERGGRSPTRKGNKEDRMGSWRTHQSSKVTKSDPHVLPHRKKSSFLEHFKKRSANQRVETASTATATLSTISSTCVPTGNYGWQHSPTLTEKSTLDESGMIVKDLFSNPPDILKIDDAPARYPLPSFERKTRQRSVESQRDVPRKEGQRQDVQKQKEMKHGELQQCDVLDQSNLEDYECFLIPPKRPNPKRRTDQKEQRQPEACFQMALEDFRTTVTASMNSAMNLWSRMQGIFSQESSSVEIEEFVKGMTWKTGPTHPSTVFVTPKDMQENQMPLECLVDSLFSPTMDAEDDVSSLTYPAFDLESKPVPPLFRMRKSDAQSRRRKSRKCLRSVPVKEILIKMSHCWEDEPCIEFSSSHDKEPYDEKDELFDETFLEKDHFDITTRPFKANYFGSRDATNGHLTSKISAVPHTESFQVPSEHAESIQLRWNDSIQSSEFEMFDGKYESFGTVNGTLTSSISRPRFQSKISLAQSKPQLWNGAILNPGSSSAHNHLHNADEADLGSVSC